MNASEQILDILRYAYIQEVKAALFYEQLANRATNPSVEAKLRECAKTEHYHQQCVTKWYELVTGKTPLFAVSKGQAEGRSALQKQPASVEAVLDMAIEAEQRARAFYRRWRERAKTDEERDLLELLADEEDDHAMILAEEKAALKDEIISLGDITPSVERWDMKC